MNNRAVSPNESNKSEQNPQLTADKQSLQALQAEALQRFAAEFPELAEIDDVIEDLDVKLDA